MNRESRRSLSTVLLIVIVVVIVAVAAGLTYFVVVRHGISSAPSGPSSAPGYLSPSSVSSCLGGAWTLNESSSFVAYVNPSTGTETIKFFNGTTITVPYVPPILLQAIKVHLGSGEFTLGAMYIYTGTLNSKPYYIWVVLVQLVNSTIANDLFTAEGYALGLAGGVQTTINGYPAVGAFTPYGSAAAMLKGNYFVYVYSNITSSTVSSNAWANLLKCELNNIP